jgi:hypothetical protein
MIIAPTSGSSDSSLLLRHDQYSGESAICYCDYVTTARVVCYCLLVSIHNFAIGSRRLSLRSWVRNKLIALPSPPWLMTNLEMIKKIQLVSNTVKR